MYILQYARNFVFLARVRVSSYNFQFWIVYHTVAQERDRGFAVVRVSSVYFVVLACISYSTQEGLRVSR